MAPHFNSVEDKRLCTAWKDITQDPIQENNQKRDVIWGKIAILLRFSDEIRSKIISMKFIEYADIYYFDAKTAKDITSITVERSGEGGTTSLTIPSAGNTKTLYSFT